MDNPPVEVIRVVLSRPGSERCKRGAARGLDTPKNVYAYFSRDSLINMGFKRPKESAFSLSVSHEATFSKFRLTNRENCGGKFFV